MKHFQLMFGCAVALAIFAVAGCKRGPAYQMIGEPNADPPTLTPVPGSPSPQETSSALATPEERHLDLAKLAGSIQPAVVLVTVFDSSGKRLRTGTGFFVSGSGTIATTWHTVEGAVNAVAKTAAGGIYNITGVVASSPKLDLAILHSEVKEVPFLALDKDVRPDPGTLAAAIGSSLAGSAGKPVEGTISVKDSGENPDELVLAISVPETSLGAPVVDEKGELIGVATSRDEKGAASSVVRPVSAVKSVVAEIASNAIARWPGEIRPSPTPRLRLVYTPRLTYPSEVGFHDGIARSGRYRVNFDLNGTVRNIQVLQSTGSDVLDLAAIKGLQQWKSEPGREGFVVVPLTFQSR